MKKYEKMLECNRKASDEKVERARKAISELMDEGEKVTIASYVYCDSDMMYIARSQMELVKGELPTQANEVAVSEYFLSANGYNAKIGETVRLDTESFHGDYTVTGILSDFRISVNDKIQSYGQLRTIGATSRQLRRIVKKESGRPGVTAGSQ